MAKGKQKRILILTADAGFGHRSAANAVSEALQQKYGEGVCVSIINPLDDKRTPFFLRDSQSDYDTLIRNTPELYRDGYEASDALVPTTLLERALTVMLFEVMREHLRNFNPDIVLTTYPLYQAPLNAVRFFHNLPLPVYTVITDLISVHRIWFNNHTDGFFVPTEEVSELAQHYHISPEKITLTGIPVSPQFKRPKVEKSLLRKELGWEPDTTTVLAVGSTRVEQLESTLNVINHFGEKVQLICVAGKDKSLYKQLSNSTWHIPVQIYEFVKEIPKFMLASDCIISKAGGLIVTESLAAGLPLLLIDIIPGQETGNAEYVVNHGAGDVALDPVAVLETFSHWMLNDQKLLRERMQNARKLGKPDSALQIAKFLWQTKPVSSSKLVSPALELRDSITELLNQHKISIPLSIKKEDEE